MKQHPPKVLVFKSNLVADEDLDTVKSLMDDHPDIIRWNVDRHDKDNVLRIETSSLQARDIKDLIVDAGFFCEELPD